VIGRLFCGQALTTAALILLAGLVVQALGAAEVETAATAAWLSALLMNGLTSRSHRRWCCSPTDAPRRRHAHRWYGWHYRWR